MATRVWRRAVVLCVLFGASAALAEDGRMQRPPDPVHIHGRVVDGAGRPVPGLKLGATTSAMGQTLYGAHTHGNGTGDSDFNAVTDTDGRFAIPVPYAGLLYSVGLYRGQSYQMPSETLLLTDDAEPLELVVSLREPMEPIHVTVRLPDGAPAAGQAVTLVGESGTRWDSETDDQGRAVFDEVRTDYIGQAVLLAGRGQLVAPLTIVRWRKAEPTEATLAEPAAVRGRVVAADTGEPIAFASVIVQPAFSSGLEWATMTDVDGRYALSGLPPGEYQYRAVCETHADRPPGGHAWFERKVTLVPSATRMASEFDMQPRATLKGRVLGPDGEPVEGAMVGCPSHHGERRDRTDATFTDASGQFTLYPAPNLSADVAIEAFHPSVGGASTPIEPFEPGEVRNWITLRTAGIARVRGVVRDDVGVPIPGVSCKYAGPPRIAMMTDAAGRYDLGVVPLRSDGTDPPRLGRVMFLPPRPSGGLMMRPGGHWKQPQNEPDGAPYYVATAHQPKLAPGGTIELDVTLDKTRLLTFNGAVTDPSGERVSNARVYLLPGRITEDGAEQQQIVTHFILQRDAMQRERLHGGSKRLMPYGQDQLRELVFTTTGEDGTWAMRCLASDTDPAVVAQLAAGSVKTPDAEVSAPDELQWATILAVWGGPNAHLLYPPVRIADDRSAYTVPAED